MESWPNEILPEERELLKVIRECKGYFVPTTEAHILPLKGLMQMGMVNCLSNGIKQKNLYYLTYYGLRVYNLLYGSDNNKST